jgi:hypothetical protein
MAELLVRIADKVPPEDRRYLLFLRAGEVVVICRDGHPWSKAEQTNPAWKIVKLPKVSVEEASMMLGERKVVPESGKLPLRREFKLDMQAIEPTAKDATYSTLDAAKIRYADVLDTSVIGLDEGVF